MSTKTKYENLIKRIKLVAELVQQHYEAGRQDRCLAWCYRTIVNKQYPMSERTFRRYISIAVNKLGYKFKEDF